MVRTSEVMPAQSSKVDDPISELAETKYPKVRPGRKYWRAGVGRTLRIGTRFDHLPLPETIAGIDIAGLLSLCDGRRNIVEIASATNSDPELINSIIEDIAELGSLEFTSSNQSKNPAFANERTAAGLSAKNFWERFNIELASTSNRFGKCTVATLTSRGNFQVEIIGSGRIATSLFSNLIAIGFSNTSISNRRHPSHQSHRVRPVDICGAQLTEGDIGQAKARLLEEIRERARLLPKDLTSHRTGKDPDLVIIVGTAAPDIQQELLSRAIPHLLVDYASSDSVRFGPFVNAARSSAKKGCSENPLTDLPLIDSPCINCITLAEIESGAPPIELLDNELEVSAALAMAGSGLAALAVAEIADTGQSVLTGQTALITTERYFEPLLTIWQRHPACGCNWL